jgi:hypothetical protein
MINLQILDVTSATVEWFERSGIQESSGGVARYHLLAEGRSLPVSTEITGYAVSALVWTRSYDRARKAADFLVDQAWRPDLQAMPFELADPLPPSYFFDCGIIVRGLLRAWRALGRSDYLRVARDLGAAMGRDFRSADGAIHPVLALPSKTQAPYEKRWSKEPGCFQCKAALAWDELHRLYPGEPFDAWFEQALHWALGNHLGFLPGSDNPLQVMDRLHAYLYFLEALLSRVHRAECAEALRIGIPRVANYLRQIGAQFERSDVCAQLLRVRLLSAAAGAVPLDAQAAEEEAWRCSKHRRDGGPAIEAGGFGFGTRDGVAMPFMNPVSSAFGMQALAWWDDWRDGRFRGSIDELI